jgi:hypothetical protein
MIGLCIGKIGYLDQRVVRITSPGDSAFPSSSAVIKIELGLEELTVNKDPIKALEKKPVKIRN